MKNSLWPELKSLFVRAQKKGQGRDDGMQQATFSTDISGFSSLVASGSFLCSDADSDFLFSFANGSLSVIFISSFFPLLLIVVFNRFLL